MKQLEGENYVTSSWVPVQVKFIHTKLKEGTQDILDGKKNTVEVKAISKLLLEDFEERWNLKGEEPIVWREKVERGTMSRQFGIHPCFIYAMCFDPRFKSLKQNKCGVTDEIRGKIWDKF